MLNAATLSTSLRAKVALRSWAVDDVALTELCDDIAAAVVEHITSSAVVLPGLLVAPSGGGPVTGTGTVT